MQVHISLNNYLREYGMYRWLTHRHIRNSKDGTILERFRGWREIQSQFLGSPEKPKRRDGLICLSLDSVAWVCSFDFLILSLTNLLCRIADLTYEPPLSRLARLVALARLRKSRKTNTQPQGKSCRSGTATLFASQRQPWTP